MLPHQPHIGRLNQGISGPWILTQMCCAASTGLNGSHLHSPSGEGRAQEDFPEGSRGGQTWRDALCNRPGPICGAKEQDS